MDLLGLVMFSISVALFGGFQKIPFTDIRPENSFTRRLYSGLLSGYVLGKSGEVLDIVLPVEQPATVLTNLNRAQPTNLTVCSSPVAPAQTFRIPTGTLASITMWANRTPEPTVARNSIKSQALITIPDFSHADSIGWLPCLLGTLRSFVLGGSDPFMTAFVFIFLVSTILLIPGAACIYFLLAYAIKGVGLNLADRVMVAYDETEKAVAESEVQRSLLLSKMESLKASVETSTLFQATNETLHQRPVTIAGSFHHCSDKVLEDCALLKKAAHDLKSEYTTQDELLHTYIKDFNDSLTTMKGDLDKEIEQLRNFIPSFTAEFHRTVKRLDGSILGSLPTVYLRGRQILESNIRSIRDAMNKVPNLSSLQNEASLARVEMEDILTQMRNIVTNGRETLRDTADIHQDIDELKNKLACLEQELALSKTALKSPNPNENGFHSLMIHPEPSILELPADPEDAAPGETSTNDQEKVNHDMQKGLQEPEEGEKSKPISFPSAPTWSVTLDDICESLRWRPMVDGHANSHEKSGWDGYDNVSSTVSLSPHYPPDKERIIFWSSSLESDSETVEEWKGGKAKDPRAQDSRNNASHRLVVTEPVGVRRTCLKTKIRAKQRATRT